MNPKQAQAHLETFAKAGVIAKMVKAENDVEVITVLAKATSEQKAKVRDVIDAAKLYLELKVQITNEVAEKVRAEGIPIPALSMAEVDSVIAGAKAHGEGKPSMSPEAAEEISQAAIARAMRLA